jgi:putative transposase
MLNRAIRGQLWLPKYISSDNDPLYKFHQWQANLRVLEVTEIKSIPYVSLSIRRSLSTRAFTFFRASDRQT